jgi:hypothetical protein
MQYIYIYMLRIPILLDGKGVHRLTMFTSLCDDCRNTAEERLQRKTTRRTRQTPEQRQARLEARRNKPVSFALYTCTSLDYLVRLATALALYTAATTQSLRSIVDLLFISSYLKAERRLIHLQNSRFLIDNHADCNHYCALADATCPQLQGYQPKKHGLKGKLEDVKEKITGVSS